LRGVVADESARVNLQRMLRLEASPLAFYSYLGTMGTMKTDSPPIVVERVQTGVRIEKRLLKVLKALAEYYEISLGDLLEGIVLHAFDGETPFTSSSLKRIRDLKKFYALDLDSSASHRLTEIKRRSGSKTASGKKK